MALRGVPEQHKRSMAHNFAIAGRLIRRAERAAGSDNCLEAIRYLRDAAFQLGAADGEARWTNDAKQLRRVAVLERRVAKTTGTVMGTCRGGRK